MVGNIKGRKYNMKSIKSNSNDWEKISNFFSRINEQNYRGKLLNFRRTADIAVEEVHSAGDLNPVDFDISINEVIEFIALKDGLSKYSSSIHNELIEKIDTPYFRQMQGFAKTVYKLNTSDTEKNVNNGEDNIDLLDMLKGVEIDPNLKGNYLDLIYELDTDKPSENLNNILDENLWQWREELSFEDIKEIDRKLYSSNHLAADVFYDMGPDLLIKNTAFNGTANYAEEDRGIRFNLEKDRKNEYDPYSTFFHEMGHMVDDSIQERKNGTIIYGNKWFSYESIYADEFYNNLIKDVNNYIDNYNKINGTNLNLKARRKAICEEFVDTKNSQVSDIYAAVMRESADGQYRHEVDYWKYSSVISNPSKEELNKEAFANFTEASINGNPKDIEAIKKMLPNAYKSYEKMIGEMR